MSNSSSGIRQLRSAPVIGQLWQRLEELPRPLPEESIWLRVLVQSLVIVGIVATDIAAETQLSWWAVPLSVAGGIWSWHRRRERNVPVKFLLAIGMLVALAFFFRGLFASVRDATNDTRIVLAELLIQVQVLHSFDLPRRKDLGYSMVIGLILLGVAGTLSQTLAFGPLLLLFLALALPTLVLDYRSRLGLLAARTKHQEPRTKKKETQNFFGFYALLFTLVVGIGLGIFALLPRFPGYQLRTFPVSAPIDIQGDFDSSRIFNPRGSKSGNQGRGTGSGTPEEGPGEVDDTFYYGFNTRMNMNLRGQMKPKVVMRVRSQAEGFWRVLAFDRYTGQGWEITRNEQAETKERPSWSYQFWLTPEPTASGTREIIQTFTAVSDMPNLIPALAQPWQLYFPTPKIAVDAEGGLRAPVGLAEGITYTVVSQVPYRNRTLLGKAPPVSPKTVRNYKEIQQHYLQLPPKTAERVRQLTEQILANYAQQQVARAPQKELTSAYEKALYLAQYLKQHYTIENIPHLGKNEDLVEAFLFKYKGGYPDHFSTVLTVMLRSIGIPARLVVGYDPGQFNPFTGYYVVSNTDAYAMAEVYFPGHGWFAFDPIPGHDVVPPSLEDYEPFSVVRQFWRWVAGWLPSPVAGLFNTVFAAIASFVLGVFAWFWSLLFRGWLGLFTGLILAICLGFLGWLGWNQWRVWRYRRWLGKLPAMEGVYQQMLGVLAAQGLRKHPAQTPLEYARESHRHAPPATAAVIDEISEAYVRWRYAGEPVNHQQLRRRLRELKPRNNQNPLQKLRSLLRRGGNI
ncbi:transglutaminase TgpA family protein [Kamptonema formosum]|uniref:transglutaminase TgpA family protein n=1 Tax=Kamptonema formosum TaxID=331992 RepID=UPI0009E3B20E|nr:DUF3488 and DUF4129 domain-containing transglutaminase family protein [Oscillatoria sp. PCC 10802]